MKNEMLNKPGIQTLDPFSISPAWLIWGICLVGLALMLGISDDEAYYWVLGKRPAMGYAYHPPAIGWSIALSDALLGGFFRLFFGDSYFLRVVVTRAPALCYIFGSVWILLRWMKQVSTRSSLNLGYSENLEPEGRSKQFNLFLAFPGVFATCWMMVPDLPLIFGWTLLFVGVSEFIAMTPFRSANIFVSLTLLFLGALFLVLSKYSGVLGIISAILSLTLLGRKNVRLAIFFIVFGFLIGLVPSLYWNATHEWVSFKYQFLERHQGSNFSIARGLRFFLIQFLVAGPALSMMPFWLRKIKNTNLRKFILIWALPPALVFFSQPFFSEFKPHWALIAWWPLAIALALLAEGRHISKKWIRIQISWAFVLTLVTWTMLLTPLMSYVGERLQGQRFNPLLDIGNDLRAWRGLQAKVAYELSHAELSNAVFAGGRYQTSAQTAFALGGLGPVSFDSVGLVPKSIREKDEWPDLGLQESQGPEWGNLLRSVYFVTDSRYTAEANFTNSRCEKKIRQQFLGPNQMILKEIILWKCSPGS